ncbi:hypothetical protein HanXRQr2_Chr01g0029241 [Helianthus annuus]|uniref:Uncharacterized protein n=1 Tax=Helianthus annuus TaxID=4232 RepID=A0A9K3JXR1_HELAN|nr:hypothetical protein HanXRQr2_Chr01g0029241 [Helianthus annuus]KAJ0957536.1 hypothetical protein HanPSC8_Chr01g0028431 [Helianthus annuus]
MQSWTIFLLIAKNCMETNNELIFLWGKIPSFKIRSEIINPP